MLKNLQVVAFFTVAFSLSAVLKYNLAQYMSTFNAPAKYYKINLNP